LPGLRRLATFRAHASAAAVRVCDLVRLRLRHDLSLRGFGHRAAARALSMRALVQRVARAEVRIADVAADGIANHARIAGRIGRGLLVLVGFTHDDDDARLAWMAEKILGLRVFADAEDRMNLAVGDVAGSVLVVSQFTLYGDARKGKRPSFVDAARPELAVPLYDRFVALLRQSGLVVETGEFGAMMQVELVNDGPVTLWLER